MFILDTDHMTLVQRAGVEGARIRQRIHEVGADDVYTSIVSFEEQTRGWLAYASRARTLEEQVETYQLLHRHLTDYCKLQVLPFDRAAAARLRLLQQNKLRIGTMDLKIAAVALVHAATLVTRNSSDFAKVPELLIEDWTI